MRAVRTCLKDTWSCLAETEKLRRTMIRTELSKILTTQATAKMSRFPRNPAIRQFFDLEPFKCRHSTRRCFEAAEPLSILHRTVLPCSLAIYETSRTHAGSCILPNLLQNGLPTPGRDEIPTCCGIRQDVIVTKSSAYACILQTYIVDPMLLSEQGTRLDA